MKFNSTDINPRNCWQIGTGDGTRSYFDIFLKYGVALVGPGDPGIEGEPGTELYYLTHRNDRNWGKILKQVEENEWIIARKGKKIILAVGKVLKEIGHSNLFYDVEGWDLQHYIKVKWYTPNSPDNIIWFDDSVLSQSTLQRCKNQFVFNTIYQTEFEEKNSQFEVEDISIPKPIDNSDIMKILIDEGLRIQDAENISLTIQRIIKLAEWYQHNDRGTLESEIIAFLILPFLIALGWSEQKIKLEYQNIDIALFKKVFKGDYSSSPEFIIEAKTFSNGLAFTHKQILNYAKKYPDCKNFIATNGFRYRLFFKDGKNLVQKGYVNLLRLNERNVLDDVPLSTIQSIFFISNFSLNETNY
ncbi:MAG: hypothetical protein ACYDEE_16280 [Ignavibacteriaceae bacterium]